jgi:hypothetical protein
LSVSVGYSRIYAAYDTADSTAHLILGRDITEIRAIINGQGISCTMTNNSAHLMILKGSVKSQNDVAKIYAIFDGSVIAF